MGRPRTHASPTDEEWLEAFRVSVSMRGVMRSFGWSPHSSGYRMVREAIQRFPDAVSHFRWQGANHGPHHVGGPRKMLTQDILVHGTRAVAGIVIRRAMLESGIPWRCVACGNAGEWLGKALVLEVDHSDGDKTNNLLANLRFLCPNCHSQTPTFRRKKSSRCSPIGRRQLA